AYHRDTLGVAEPPHGRREKPHGHTAIHPTERAATRFGRRPRLEAHQPLVRYRLRPGVEELRHVGRTVDYHSRFVGQADRVTVAGGQQQQRGRHREGTSGRRGETGHVLAVVRGETGS
ncbi:MAG: hypothetical protein ACK55I_19755, partial [bacterium]